MQDDHFSKAEATSTFGAGEGQNLRQSQSQNRDSDGQAGDRLIQIDGVAYKASDLSQEALQLIDNIQMVEAKLSVMKQEAAMFNTARLAYIQALKQALPEKSRQTPAQDVHSSPAAGIDFLSTD